MRSGTLIEGRFVIGERAGAGGMGTVYRARDEQSGATVAVKVVRESEERFAREVDILARMDHPAIVRYVAHGMLEDGRYLVMEWMQGEDLQRRLARGKLSPSQALALGRCAASALAEVHARGIVHRDLKPSNIWLRDGAAARCVERRRARHGQPARDRDRGCAAFTIGGDVPREPRARLGFGAHSFG